MKLLVDYLFLAVAYNSSQGKETKRNMDKMFLSQLHVNILGP